MLSCPMCSLTFTIRFSRTSSRKRGRSITPISDCSLARMVMGISFLWCCSFRGRASRPMMSSYLLPPSLQQSSNHHLSIVSLIMRAISMILLLPFGLSSFKNRRKISRKIYNRSFPATSTKTSVNYHKRWETLPLQLIVESYVGFRLLDRALHWSLRGFMKDFSLRSNTTIRERCQHTKTFALQKTWKILSSMRIQSHTKISINQ